MKRILQIVLMMVASLTGFSQNMPTRAQLQPINATGYEWQTGSFKKGLYLPKDTLQSADSGAVAIKNNVLYIKNISQGVNIFWGPISGGGSAPTWQQTLDVSHNTYGGLVFDTSITKPTGVEDPAEHTWFIMQPLVKADNAYSSPFYWNQYGGLNNGRTNEVMIWGWNMSPGGGHMQPNKPALGFSLESNYFTDRGNGLKRFMESHLYYVDSNGLQYRPWSYEINTTDGVNNFYHSVSSFTLRGFGSVSSPQNTPYFTVQGTSNTVEQSYINPSDQTEYFHIGSNFEQDVNTAAYTIGASSGKPINIFNLTGFNNASVPDLSVNGFGYDGGEIRISGATTGQLSRLLADSSQTSLANFTNVPMNFVVDGITGLALHKTKARMPVPLAINSPFTSPIANIESRANSASLEAAGWFSQEGTTGNTYGIEVYANGASSTNEGIYVAAQNATNNRGLRIQFPLAGANNYSIFSDATAKSYFAGNIGVGIGMTSPDSTVDINGSIRNNAGVRMTGLPSAAGTKSVRIDADGNLSTADTIITPVVFKNSTTWDPASVGANSSVSTTLTVTGAVLGDGVVISKTSGSFSNGEVYFGYVSATNTVTIQLQNVSGGSFDIASATFNVIVYKY